MHTMRTDNSIINIKPFPLRCALHYYRYKDDLKYIQTKFLQSTLDISNNLCEFVNITIISDSLMFLFLIFMTCESLDSADSLYPKITYIQSKLYIASVSVTKHKQGTPSKTPGSTQIYLKFYS